jgi:hypothetical protein
MPAVNLFSRIRGSASLHYIGQDFWTKDVTAFEIELKPSEIMSDAYGTISRRQGSRLVTVTFTPIGVWTAAQLAVLFPSYLLNPRQGDFNTPVRTVTAVTTASSEVTIPNHGFISGTGVRVGATGAGAALPTGLAALTTYYVNAVDANTLKFYDNEADAITGGAGGLIALPSVGAGKIKVIQNTPLIITTTDGLQLTVWNAAIVDMPGLTLSSLTSTMKQVKIEGYTLAGQQWSDANSVYTFASGTIGATPPDQSQIPSVPYTVDWLVAGITPREAIEVMITTSWEDVMSDANGLDCRSIKKVEPKIEFVPTNLDLGDILTDAAVQGGTAVRGQNLPIATMSIYGPGNNPYLQFPGVSLQNTPGRMGASADRVDKLTFMGERTFTGGAVNPMAYVGVAVP